MKKLSKVLSLVLVIAMVFSLCVIGASAKSFTDTDKVTADYKEAVDVVSDFGIIQGMTTTTFEGQGTLTRAQACALIARMTLGVTTADNMTVSGVKFTDVPATFWGYKYVQYCATASIVSGVGGNKFAPNATLTGYQFAKMLMAALGVDVSECVGANWAITTAQLYYKTGFSDVAITNATLSREAASQMVYDAMFYAVDATSGYPVYKTDKNTTPATVTTVGYYDTAAQAAAQAAMLDAIDTDAKVTYASGAKTTVDAGSTLAKTVFGVSRDMTIADDFGRPGTTYTVKMSTAAATKAAVAAYGWTSTSKFVSTTPVVTYTGVTKASKVLTDLTGYYIGAAKITSANVKTISDLTANGKLVEVYADSQGAVHAVEIVYTVGTVSAVTTAKDKTTYTITNAGTPVTGIDYVDPDTDDTIAFATAPVKGDVVTYVKAAGVTYVYPTTNVSGIQTSRNSADETITVADKAYTVGTGVMTGAANVAWADFGNKTTAAVYYIDQFGYVVKTTATAASTNYAYIVNAVGKVDTTVLGNTPTVQVLAVLQDGTVSAYNLKLTKVTTGADTGDYTAAGVTVVDSDNPTTIIGMESFKGNVFGYTVSGDNIVLEALTAGVVTANVAANTVYSYATGADVKTGTTSVATNPAAAAVMNSNTVYVCYNSTKNTATVYTGNTAIPSTVTIATGAKMVAVSDTNKALSTKVVFAVDPTDTAAVVKNCIYVDATAYVESGDATHTYYAYKGVAADGSTVDVKSVDAVLAKTGIYTYNSDNTIADSNKLADTTTLANPTKAEAPAFYDATLTVTGSLLQAGASDGYYNITADTKVVYVNSALTEINENGGYVVLATTAAGALTSNVAVIYVTVD